MFIPAYFRNTELSKIETFIRNHSFATIISTIDGQPCATHIPLELELVDGKSILSGHISRANPQWKSFSNGESVMAIFQGPHAYVSSSWYHHINVPTWNYIAVHVYGKLKILEEELLTKKLETLVNKYEQKSKNPFRMEQLPAEMMHNYLKGIVGFEMSMEKIEGKWKLSQNRDPEDFQSIIRELELLEDLNARLIAEEMKNIRSLK